MILTLHGLRLRVHYRQLRYIPGDLEDQRFGKIEPVIEEDLDVITFEVVDREEFGEGDPREWVRGNNDAIMEAAREEYERESGEDPDRKWEDG